MARSSNNPVFNNETHFAMCAKGLLNKRGISLITVLMFMLLATIGATMVFRWLTSENFSSGDRLKQTEAYRASQAGVETMHGWLTNNAAATGALVKQYLAQSGQRQPILIADGTSNDSILNSGMTGGVSSIAKDQKFSVYLTGVDTSKIEGGKNPIKLKFAITGEARDSSRYSQIAIFSVSGLYKVTYKVEKSQSANFKYAYFGPTLKYNGEDEISSMAINGDWGDGNGNNPSVIKEDFIVTGTAKLSGNNAQVHGTSCVGKDLYIQNNKGPFGDVFVNGNFNNVSGTFLNNVYVKGNLNQDNSNIDIGGNLTVGGTLNPNLGAAYFTIGGNLVMGVNGEIYLGSENREFKAKGHVCIPNSRGFTQYSENKNENGTNGKYGALLGDNATSKLYMNGVTKVSPTPAAVGTGYSLYKTNNYNKYIKSRATSVNPTVDIATCADNGIESAMSVETYCNLAFGDPKPGCNGSQYFIEDPLTTAYETFKTKAIVDPSLSLANGGCGITSSAGAITLNGGGPALVTALNACYKHYHDNNDNTKLYNDFLVVNLRWGSLTNFGNPPAPLLKGKFVFIVKGELGQTEIPATENDASVFMFLEDGAKGEIMFDNCTDCNTCTYRYFIYSKKYIKKLMGHKKCGISGSVYIPAEPEPGVKSCNFIPTEVDGAHIQFSESLFLDLSDKGIICAKNSPDCGATGSGSGSGTSSGSGDSNDPSMVIDTSAFAPVSPRLKVNLETQYQNREVHSCINSGTCPKRGGFILVMPRIIKLGKNAEGELSRYYSVLTSKPTPVTSTPTCDNPISGNAPLTGNYTPGTVSKCTLSDGGLTSTFWVVITGKDQEAGATRVSMAQREVTFNSAELATKPCQPVSIKWDGSPKDFSVGIYGKSCLDNNCSDAFNGNGWSFNPAAGVSLQGSTLTVNIAKTDQNPKKIGDICATSATAGSYVDISLANVLVGGDYSTGAPETTTASFVNVGYVKRENFTNTDVNYYCGAYSGADTDTPNNVACACPVGSQPGGSWARVKTVDTYGAEYDECENTTQNKNWTCNYSNKSGYAKLFADNTSNLCELVSNENPSLLSSNNSAAPTIVKGELQRKTDLLQITFNGITPYVKVTSKLNGSSTNENYSVNLSRCEDALNSYTCKTQTNLHCEDNRCYLYLYRGLEYTIKLENPPPNGHWNWECNGNYAEACSRINNYTDGALEISLTGNQTVVVNAGKGCGYNPTMCNGIPFDDVVFEGQTNPLVADAGAAASGRCFFATSITSLATLNGVNPDPLVNGQEVVSCGGSGQPTCAATGTGALANIPKVDGGYYVYVSGNNPRATGLVTLDNGSNTCTDKGNNPCRVLVEFPASKQLVERSPSTLCIKYNRPGNSPYKNKCYRCTEENVDGQSCSSLWIWGATGPQQDGKDSVYDMSKIEGHVNWYRVDNALNNNLWYREVPCLDEVPCEDDPDKSCPCGDWVTIPIKTNPPIIPPTNPYTTCFEVARSASSGVTRWADATWTGSKCYRCGLANQTLSGANLQDCYYTDQVAEDSWFWRGTAWAGNLGTDGTPINWYKEVPCRNALSSSSGASSSSNSGNATCVFQGPRPYYEGQDIPPPITLHCPDGSLPTYVSYTGDMPTSKTGCWIRSNNAPSYTYTDCYYRKGETGPKNISVNMTCADGTSHSGIQCRDGGGGLLEISETILRCGRIQSTGWVRTDIAQPTVQCNTDEFNLRTNPEYATWTDAPTWYIVGGNSPTRGWYNSTQTGTHNVSVKVNIGACKTLGLTASCDATSGGTINVVPSEIICNGTVPSTALAGTAISSGQRPTAACNNRNHNGGTNTPTTTWQYSKDGGNWTNFTTAWTLPSAGTYQIRPTGSCGVYSTVTSGTSGNVNNANSGLQGEPCSGTITVNNNLACGSITSVTIGSAITRPTVTCNGATVNATNVTWPGMTTNWWTANTLAVGTYSITAKPSTGDCKDMTAVSCGSVTVRAASSSSSSATVTLTCSNTITTVAAGTAIPGSQRPTRTCSDNSAVVGYFQYNDGTGWSSDFAWTSTGSWTPPAAGTYSLRATNTTCGGVTVADVNCTGTLTVTAPTPSSSSSTPVNLTCTGLATTGKVGTAITAPTVKCGTTTLTTGITWENAPTWSSPAAAGTYNNVIAKANCDGSQQTANCSGTLTVSNNLICGTVPSSGTAGTAITPPTVTCNGTTVTAGNVTWTNAPNWTTPTAGTYSNITAKPTTAPCNSSTTTAANCSGTLTVSSSSSATLACSALPQTTGTVGTAITPPTVTCNGTTVSSSSVTWENAPNWSNPNTATTYSNVRAKANCGGSEKTANCSGTLTVNAAVASIPSCVLTTSTVNAGTTFTVSNISVTCSNGGSLGTQNLDDNFRCCPSTNPSNCNFHCSSLTAGSYSVLVGAQCNNTYVDDISCGTLTVNAPSSSSVTPPSSSSGGGGSTTVTLNNTSYEQLPTGAVTLSCGAQERGVNCYANPAESFSIGCGSIYNYANSGSPGYLGNCGGAIGNVSCDVPAGKTVYCKLQ